MARKKALSALVRRLREDEPFAFMLRARLINGVHIDLASGCWEWQRRSKPNGTGERYGVLTARVPGFTNPQPFAVHVLAWVLFGGKLNARHVRAHTCDNPICCNPAHIEQKTQSENISDCADRYRHNSFKRTRYYETLGDRGAPGPDVPF